MMYSGKEPALQCRRQLPAGLIVIEAWFRGYWGSPGLGGLRIAVLSPLAGLLDYEDTILKTSESALYQLEGGWIGDFYESLQNMEVMKTNNRNDTIRMQRKVDYTRQAIVKYSMKWKHKDYQQLGSKDQDGR